MGRREPDYLPDDSQRPRLEAVEADIERLRKELQESRAFRRRDEGEHLLELIDWQQHGSQTGIDRLRIRLYRVFIRASRRLSQIAHQANPNKEPR